MKFEIAQKLKLMHRKNESEGQIPPFLFESEVFINKKTYLKKNSKKYIFGKY